MNNSTFGPGSPKPFHAYSRRDIDLESGNFRKPRQQKSLVSRFIRMIKSIGNQISYIYKLHPLLVFIASLIFGLAVLIVLSMYENSFLLMKQQNDKLSLVYGSYPMKNLHNLVMVAGHSIYISSTCGKFDSEDSWFLEPYQKHPGQAATFIAHIKEGVKIAAQDENALLLFSGGETRNGAGPRSEAQSYWAVAEAKGWFGKGTHLHLEHKKAEGAEEEVAPTPILILAPPCQNFQLDQLVEQFDHGNMVVSYDFKKERFSDLHRSSIRFPEERFFFVGTPTTPDSKDAAMAGEAIVRAQFQVDPYGCTGSLQDKRLKRDPFHRSVPYPGGCPELKSLFSYCGPVVSYDFKKERFSDLHRSSIRFPEERFFFVGTPTTPDSKDAAMAGEAIVRAQFQVDPYGCTGSLQDKRLKRDPFHRSVPYPGGCPELKSLFSYCGPAIYPGALPW
ncbi:uncharacterized protein C57A10.07 [Dendrobium catenatum]|uniref:uncharacterized protein C57A10.07 n=1 Tax=Dendrobium catenatum TaxID=906689 RepID=UPI0010A09A22|nr:uncharacterized protein C57A10.07 [Dendrobium catenatum]